MINFASLSIFCHFIIMLVLAAMLIGPVNIEMDPYALTTMGGEGELRAEQL